MEIANNLIAFNNAVQTFILQHRDYLLFAMSFCLGGGGAWFISRTPMRIMLMDHPESRSSHNVAIPRGGGFGILLVVILAGLALKIPTYFLFPAIFVSFISFYNDFFQMSVRARLIIQILAAIIMLFPSLPYMIPQNSAMPVLFTILIFIAVILFAVGTANFYNFMDGINGIAGISGFIAFSLIGIFAPAQSHIELFKNMPLFSICIALSCLGFLPYNMPKARVFLGDVGSILLGFLFAGLIIKLSHNILDFVCLAAFLFPFYADELTTMWVRFRDGEKLSVPHRRHLYQLLANEYGLAHWKVSLLYGIVQVFAALSVIYVRPRGIMFVLPLLVFYFILFSCISFYLRRMLAARQ
ncbi:MAG: putative undecaprenyl-phosphate N-acetylglucosaminyl 1-phosphate transferase [Smithella sp. PtaU1.Bin162]|nr:MAG: putative undecaprenyl-phosphate N-acetylglucosaminyl 1-phosphate transferase [Smithella sp. PtaU1.Bin162]